MNLTSRAFNGLFVLIALGFAAANLPAEWLLKLHPLTDQSGDAVSLRQVQLRKEKLLRSARSANERLCFKEKVAEELDCGNISLIEAAGCFRALYADPESWQNPFRVRPAHDDGEGWCREVIRWMELRMQREQPSDKLRTFRYQLESELRDQLEHYGSVTLPG